MASALSQTRRLRIAILSRHFDARMGGAERYATEVVDQLRLHHDCWVYCQSHQAMEGVHFQVWRSPMKKPRWLALLLYAFWAKRSIGRNHDVVISNENAGFGQLQLVHVVPIRHALFASSSWHSIWRKMSWWFSPRLVTYLGLEWFRFRPQPGRWLIAPSHMTGELLVADMGYSTDSVVVVEPGVKPVDAGVQRQGQALREQLGLKSSDHVVLMVAHDLEKKGLPLVLRAMTQWPSDVHVVVVGEDGRLPHWQNLAQQMGCQHRLHLVGRCHELGAAYAMANVLVHATQADVYGMVLIEAMAHGLPVVCSPAPFCGAAMGWQNGIDACLLSHPNDLQGLVHAVLNLRADPALVERLVSKGRSRAAHQTWARAGEAFLRLVQDAKAQR
jgi:glycosyltransferase involved in cell wall biosynthesis